MAEIEIPFKPEMALAVIEGRKYCTSRNKEYGGQGDTFWVEAEGRRAKCVLLGCTKLPLYFVSPVLYDLEGLDSPKDFEDIWKEIHPREGWTPMKWVWVHWFQRQKCYE